MRYYTGIFLISAATLLLEITLTRIFSVLFFHHFAFLVISTALFGFGFSGIFLLFRKPAERERNRRLALFAVLFAGTMLLAYKTILLTPYRFPRFANAAQVIDLLLNYAVLAVPFFFSGLIIILILDSSPSNSGKLYGFDLAGAAIGCLIVIWLVPAIGAPATIAVAALLAALAAVIFRPSILSVAAVACILALLPRAKDFLEIPIQKVATEKQKGYMNRIRSGIEYSAWSPVSRIDVIDVRPRRLILLDGGSNVSFMIPFNGDYSRLQPLWSWRAVPYAFSNRKDVCIIGPGGGEDVLLALSQKASSITAVEMDPLIVEIVQGKYKQFIGGIYNNPSVTVVNDEGRSYVRRSSRQYDLIQQVHNISPVAIATGALNLSESYLLTKEAFQEYWDHLKPGGMLAINRFGILRAASIASLVLQQNGISDPENYVVVAVRKGTGIDSSFYLKKGRITPQDLQKIQEQPELKIDLVYAPLPEFQNESNPYYRLLVPSLREKFIREADLVLDAPTDDWPFFDHFQPFGKLRTSTTILPREFNAILQYFNMGDLALLTLLAEAIILSTVFLLLPLFRFRKIGTSQWGIFAYFAALGAGFILIEISLIQKYILFLGQPVYSISAVLFSMLLSAGIGSWLYQKYFREGSERRWLAAVLGILFVVLLFEIFVVPRIFLSLLHAGNGWRFTLSALFIAPLGLILGIPFPLGIRVLGSRFPEAIPWAWGLNAYTTVIGSILCVIFAVTLGFRMNFVIAFLTYAAGLCTFAVTVLARRD